MTIREQVKIRWRLAGGLIGLGLLAVTVNAQAEPVLMSAEWAVGACDAWNNDPVLTDGLAKSGWVQNDKDRGHKVIHFYRTDCTDSPRVEIQISEKDSKAMCVYGGSVKTAEVDTDVGYIMHATTQRWQEMGRGEYGPMKGMMLGRLKFSGPMWEAMKNMGPFKNFLLLVGKVPSSSASCP